MLNIVKRLLLGLFSGIIAYTLVVFLSATSFLGISESLILGSRYFFGPIIALILAVLIAILVKAPSVKLIFASLISAIICTLFSFIAVGY